MVQLQKKIIINHNDTTCWLAYWLLWGFKRFHLFFEKRSVRMNEVKVTNLQFLSAFCHFPHFNAKDTRQT